VKAELAKLDAARRDIEKKERQHVVERRKFAEDRNALGPKLTRLAELEKAQAQAKLNPAAFMQSVYGDKWYDVLIETRLNGVPPADLIAAEVAKIEEKVEQRFSNLDAERKKAEEASQQQRIDGARRSLRLEANEFLKDKAADYPVFEQLGSTQAVAAMIAQRIEQEYNRTERRDPATGELLMAGRILTHKEAADLLEADALGLAEKVASHAKYQEKLRAKLQPAQQPAAVGGPKLQRPENQQRRTLSNDLTASTPGRAPPVSLEEKRQRAIARFEEMHIKAPT
jgi:hypothetical protein